MSASSPVTLTPARNAYARVDVSRALLQIDFKRRLWRACAEVLIAVAGALALLGLVALIDYASPVKRAWRSAFVVPVWFAVSFVVVRAVWNLIKRRTLAEAAREIERAARSTQNALVTFAEYAQRNTSTPRDAFNQSYILPRLERQAQNELIKTDEALVLPRRNLRRSSIALALTLLLLFIFRLVTPLAFAREVNRVLWLARDDAAITRQSGRFESNDADKESVPVVIDEFRVRVVPPSYAGLGSEELVGGDAPVRALAGSQIEVTLQARGAVEKATLGFGGITSVMRALGQNRFSGTFNATASGALEARVIAADDTQSPVPLVRVVEVYADAPPEARITEPVGDQLLRAVPDHPVELRWTARDDLGLQRVAMKYIKSRGEGDAAKFTNGEVSLTQTEHVNNREWRGQGALDLTHLDMQAGDTLVFWIEARDRDPFANNVGRSASLSIAIKGPEVFKLDLSDLRPSEIGRFLLSERLILMHTEKLHGERARLAPTELMRRANNIAAEQRDFKNSFNDYINIEGAGEDEHQNGAGQPATVEDRAQATADERTEIHNHGIPDAPSGSPASVTDMTFAIRAMWDAEDSLSIGDTAKALAFEHEALVRLKRAQAAVRYVPPVLPKSKPLDLKRRYAGELAEIKTQLEKLARRPVSKETAPVRAALGDAYSALAELQATLNVPVVGRLSAIARARDKASAAANRLVSVGGDHAATIAEAAAQLRIVETELQRTETSGTSDEFTARLAKPLALLAQAASNLYAIAQQSTRSGSTEVNSLSPSDDGHADEYFRRLTRRAAP